MDGESRVERKLTESEKSMSTAHALPYADRLRIDAGSSGNGGGKGNNSNPAAMSTTTTSCDPDLEITGHVKRAQPLRLNSRTDSNSNFSKEAAASTHAAASEGNQAKASPSSQRSSTTRSSSRTSASSSSSTSVLSSSDKEDEKDGDESDHFSEKDRKGRINCKPGDIIAGKYKIIKLAGQGTFGTVLEVEDLEHPGDNSTDHKFGHPRRLALKVVRAVPRYGVSATVEYNILQSLANADPKRESLCVRVFFKDHIEHGGQRHVAIGFEPLGSSLYSYLKKNRYRGFRLKDVRSFAFQMLIAVAFCHRAGIVHTDLKPENVLLVNSESDYSNTEPMHVKGLACEQHSLSYSKSYAKQISKAMEHERRAAELRRHGHEEAHRELEQAKQAFDKAASLRKPYMFPKSTEVRLIDFGGATLPHQHHPKIINTREYRSPEVILGLGWGYASDLWSTGCVLAELFSGEQLFNTHDDLEHLALIQHVLEKQIPLRMGQAALGVYPTSESPDASSMTDHPQRYRGGQRGEEKSSGKSSNSVPKSDSVSPASGSVLTRTASSLISSAKSLLSVFSGSRNASEDPSARDKMTSHSKGKHPETEHKSPHKNRRGRSSSRRSRSHSRGHSHRRNRTESRDRRYKSDRDDHYRGTKRRSGRSRSRSRSSSRGRRGYDDSRRSSRYESSHYRQDYYNRSRSRDRRRSRSHESDRSRNNGTRYRDNRDRERDYEDSHRYRAGSYGRDRRYHGSRREEWTRSRSRSRSRSRNRSASRGAYRRRSRSADYYRDYDKHRRWAKERACHRERSRSYRYRHRDRSRSSSSRSHSVSSRSHSSSDYSRSRSSSPSSRSRSRSFYDGLDPSIWDDPDGEEKRDWTKARSRSKSTLSADELIRPVDFKIRWPGNATSRKSVETVRTALTLKKIVFAGWRGDAEPSDDNPSLGELTDFYDFLVSLLHIDPSRRPTAKEALYHKFFEPLRDSIHPPSFLMQHGPLPVHVNEKNKLARFPPERSRSPPASSAPLTDPRTYSETLAGGGSSMTTTGRTSPASASPHGISKRR